MQNTKILAALMFGIIGYWAFSFTPDGEATHILISETAASRSDGQNLAVVFKIENQGAPDRLLAVTSSAGKAVLLGVGADGLSVPAGDTFLTQDGAHIQVTSDAVLEDDARVPIKLQFEEAGTVSALIRYATP
ncbi:hypothetical protein N9L47_11015 [Rhodobacteraceae bacterium]|nr:hypothetical protein [Paracoccaceae bacterium]